MMPLSDGNPFALARLAPGITYNGDLKFSRPFDNGGTSGIVTGGASGGNEFSLDGSPNMANGRRVAFVPPAGAVQEFKVETAELRCRQRPHRGRQCQRDAQERHELHSRDLRYTYYRSDKLAETDFFVIKRGSSRNRSLGYKRPGVTIGGPGDSGLTTGMTGRSSSAPSNGSTDEFPEPLFQTVPTPGDAQRRLLGAARRRASSSTIR